jgi:ABC-2 type transport system permease protein
MIGGFDKWRAWSIARKEVRHIARDPFTLAFALGLPVLIVTFFGYAIDFNVRDVGLLVADGDHTRASRELAEVFAGSGYFRLKQTASPATALQEIDQERGKGALIIPPGFGRDLEAGRPVSAQIVLDGADNSSSGMIASYLAGLQSAAAVRLLGSAPRPLTVETRFLFNPELNSRWFVVPGLAVVVIGLLATLLTALTVAREYENGSMEMLLATPVRPLEIILGKLIPYVGLGLAAVLFVYVLARVGFGVPFRGSHLLFGAAVMMFLATTLAQGLVISVVTRQQQIAMQMSMVTGLLPVNLLSGFIFPIASMPVFFQYFTAILPARWFMTITRAIFLKGSGLPATGVPLAVLAVLCTVFITVALRKFKTDMEP